MIRVMLLCVLMIPSRSFGQTITINISADIQQHQVGLIPADAYDASKYLNQIAGSDVERIRSLLPYSVVLVNNGPERLLAANVGFRWTDSEGNTRQSTFAHNYFNNGFACQIATGQGRLFVLQRGLNVYFARRAVEPRFVDPTILAKWIDLLAGIHSILRSARNISAFIDSVVIEGVGLVGPDTLNMKSHDWNRTTTY